MTSMSISRSEGLDMRLNMLADNFTILPRDIVAKILAMISANEAATRISKFWRGLRARISTASRYDTIIIGGRRFAKYLSMRHVLGGYPRLSTSELLSNARISRRNYVRTIQFDNRSARESRSDYVFEPFRPETWPRAVSGYRRSLGSHQLQI